MTEYEDIISRAPDPELADKIMNAIYILANGQPNINVSQKDVFDLTQSMTLEELKRNARIIMEKNK